MIGIIYSLVSLVGGTVSSIKTEIENIHGIQRGINRFKSGKDITRTYFDYKGIQRDITTNKIVSVRSDYNEPCNDKWLWCGTPSVKTRNISAELREIEYKNAKANNTNGRTVALYDTRLWSNDRENKNKVIIKGYYYKDFQNNQLYVCRSFQNEINGVYKRCKFYMDIKTGLLVRKADTQFIWDKKNPGKYVMTEEETNSFIKQFNNKQKNGGWYPYGDDAIERKQNFYCNQNQCIDWDDISEDINVNHILMKEIY